MESIGTPFYGTLNHHARYYLGEGMLAPVYERKTMAALVATMPGPFTLIFPSKRVYERDFHIRQGGDRESPVHLAWRPWPGLVDQDRAGAIVRDPRFWFSLDEGATP